jgi:hypothetical protein
LAHDNTLSPPAGGIVQHAVAILLVQIALAAVALFVLADGPRWMRDNLRFIARFIALAIALAAALAWTTWSGRWALDNWGHGAFALMALAGAGCLRVCVAGAREALRWSLSRPVRGGETSPIEYEFERGEDQWYVHDGVKERGPFSTAELIERFSNAEIASSHYLWKPGMDGWRRAYAVGLERRQAVPIPLRDEGNDPEMPEPDLPPSLGRR